MRLGLEPRHAVLEALHRPAELVDVLSLAPDGQAHIAAGDGGEGVLDAGEVARHECEEIARLGEGVLELSVVPAALELARGQLVAVGEQQRVPG